MENLLKYTVKGDKDFYFKVKKNNYTQYKKRYKKSIFLLFFIF